jgi:glyceraldehyde-3-phosphate dehydrogenase (NADP+)
VDDAIQHGAQVLNPHGGEINGSFFFPAVVSPVSEKMRLFYEEQFGPIIPIVPFEEDEEAMHYVVNSPFGQQLSIFGKDSQRVARLIDACANQVGRININTQCQRGPDSFPFSGRKDSAEGTLSVSDALRVFSIRTLVATKTTAENKALFHNILTRRESAFLTTDYIF